MTPRPSEPTVVRIMPCKLPAVLLAAVTALAARTARAEVPVVDLDGVVHAVSARHVVQALDRADAEGAPLVVVRMNTPGGLDGAMRQIVDRMLASRTPVAVFIAPSGARGASAGFVILEAADVAAMAPGTNTGAAHPVNLGGQMDEVMSKKVTSDAAAYIRGKAERRGRNVEMAEKAVVESKSFTEKEALELRLIDLVAKDVPDLLAPARRPRAEALRRDDGEAPPRRPAYGRAEDGLAAGHPLDDRQPRGAVPAAARRPGRARGRDQPSRPHLPGRSRRAVPDPVPVREPDHPGELGRRAAGAAGDRPFRGRGEGALVRSVDDRRAGGHDPRRDDARRLAGARVARQRVAAGPGDPGLRRLRDRARAAGDPGAAPSRDDGRGGAGRHARPGRDRHWRRTAG